MSVMPPPALGRISTPGSTAIRVAAQVAGLVAAAVLVALAMMLGA